MKAIIGIDEVGRIFIRILAEEGVGERAVAPPKAEEVDTYEQERERIGHIVNLMRGDLAAHDDAVGQGKGQVAGHKCHRERIRLIIHTVLHDGHRLDTRSVSVI